MVEASRNAAMLATCSTDWSKPILRCGAWSSIRVLECPGDEYWAHRNGQAEHLPGLYFVGLPKQRNFASATLRGVGQDASYIMPSLMRFVRDMPV